MSGLDIESWVGRRTFVASRVCQNIVTNLQATTGESRAEDVADAMSVMLKKPYDARDVRMIMGSSESADETAALVKQSDLFRRFTDNIEESRKRLIDDGNDPLWVGFAAGFLTDRAAYVGDCNRLVRLYSDALKCLPDFEEGKDLTEVVAFPNKPGQHPVVSQFIDSLMEHFVISPGTVMIPNPDNWLCAEYIVLRTVETETGVTIVVFTPKGTIVLNAAPV